MTARARVLVVDDDELVVVTAKRVLERICQVEGESDPHGALGRLEAQAFDLILVDLRMGGMDGLAVIERAQRLQPEIVPIVMTGFPAFETAIAAMKVGVYDYLIKPLDPGILRAVVQHAWGARVIELENRALVAELREANATIERFVGKIIEVQETERGRIARELHDEIGQSLTGLLLGLKSLDGVVESTPAQERLVQLREQVRELIDGAGRLARGLRPAALDDLGLLAASERHIADYGNATGLVVTLVTSGFSPGVRLTRAAETAAYRIMQEALTNVAKHAEASRVDVALSLEHDELTLRICDDGRGLDIAAVGGDPVHPGIGLTSMRERAALLNGTLEIESSQEHGTTIEVCIPAVH